MLFSFLPGHISFSIPTYIELLLYIVVEPPWAPPPLPPGGIERNGIYAGGIIQFSQMEESFPAVRPQETASTRYQAEEILGMIP